ncbi:MAG: S8 family serine peptidase [Henriciella sp.]|nr:S8 family serine peptidase [Henriciella sp.]
MTLRHILLGSAAFALVACTPAETPDAADTAVEETVETAATEDAAPAGSVITSEADLPRTEITLTKKPSEIVLGDGPEYDTLVGELDVAVTDLLENYQIEDDGTLRGVLSAKRVVLSAQGDWEGVLATSPQMLELASKPADKEMSGVISDSFARAALSTGETSGEAFEAAFRSEIETALAGVDVNIARDELQATRGQMQLVNVNLLEASLKAQIDPLVEQSGMTIDRGMATSIVGIKQTMAMVPYMPMIGDLIGERLEQVPEVEAVDLWSPRVADVADGEEVLIAVWDTGVDSSIQGERMWVNPSNEGPGYAHGIAFGPDFELEQSDLITEGADYADQMDGLYDTIKGSLDLQAGLETPEKAAFLAQIQEISPENMMDFQKSLSVASNYVHGQHVADIAAEGNGAAKLLNVRFTWPTDPLPTEPIDEEWAEGLVAAAKTSVDFLKANDVKVVNMSWRVTRPMVESMLQITGAEPEADKRQERAAAIFKIMEDGLIEAFASAPDILFVAGAGNEDENVEFVTSVPAGINLPNVITIGAVDQELQAAGFTSYGESIDLYANGFEVPGRVPGGRELKLSGTSMAAPQVANLAGKLWATNPDLTVADVVETMVDTATTEGEQELPVIHPVNAIASVK